MRHAAPRCALRLHRGLFPPSHLLLLISTGSLSSPHLPPTSSLLLFSHQPPRALLLLSRPSWGAQWQWQCSGVSVYVCVCVFLSDVTLCCSIVALSFLIPVLTDHTAILRFYKPFQRSFTVGGGSCALWCLLCVRACVWASSWLKRARQSLHVHVFIFGQWTTPNVYMVYFTAAIRRTGLRDPLSIKGDLFCWQTKACRALVLNLSLFFVAAISFNRTDSWPSHMPFGRVI